MTVIIGGVMIECLSFYTNCTTLVGYWYRKADMRLGEHPQGAAWSF